MKRETLFQELNANFNIFEPSLVSNIRCPICWEQFDGQALLNRRITIEHVPPTQVANLIGEKVTKTLTCAKCNHTFGSKIQADLKRFLIHQLQTYGKYDKPIRGKVRVGETEALNSNIIMTSERLNITGIPKANNPKTINEHLRFLDSSSGKGSFEVHVDICYGYRRPMAWSAYLHSAYLLVFVITKCQYPFTPAGEELRKYLASGKSNELGCCLIEVPQAAVGLRVNPWIAVVVEPEDLKCFLVKIAGNIVILPFGEDNKLSCYGAWQRACKSKVFGLAPTDVKCRIVCPADDLAVIEKVLGPGRVQDIVS